MHDCKGQNHPLSPEAYGYRVEALVDFVVYTTLGNDIIRCERERFYHQNLRPIALPPLVEEKKSNELPVRWL